MDEKHISMELIADGARVTALSMSGSRLTLTIEAELAESKVNTTAQANPADSARRRAMDKIQPPTGHFTSPNPSGQAGMAVIAPPSRISSRRPGESQFIVKPKVLEEKPIEPGRDETRVVDMPAPLPSGLLLDKAEKMAEAQQAMRRSTRVFTKAANISLLGSAEDSESESNEFIVAQPPRQRNNTTRLLKKSSVPLPLGTLSGLSRPDEKFNGGSLISTEPPSNALDLDLGLASSSNSGPTIQLEDHAPVQETEQPVIPQMPDLSLSDVAMAPEPEPPAAFEAQQPEPQSPGALLSPFGSISPAEPPAAATLSLDPAPSAPTLSLEPTPAPASEPGLLLDPTPTAAPALSLEPAPAAQQEAPTLSLEPKENEPSLQNWGAPISPSEPPVVADESSIIGGDRHGEPQPTMDFSVAPPEPEAPPAPAPLPEPPPIPMPGAPADPQSQDEAQDQPSGSTTVLVRFTCPKCQTRGMLPINKVDSVVQCTNCGKKMHLKMKK